MARKSQARSKRKPWDVDRASRIACAKLVHGGECLEPACTASHDDADVQRTKKIKKLCKNGEDCVFLRQGNCVHIHPQIHIDRDKKLKQDREKAKMEYLRPERLAVFDTSTLALDGNVAIADKGELSSFNMLYGNEIVVPGSPPRFRTPLHPLNVRHDVLNNSLDKAYPKYTYPFEPLLASVTITRPAFNVFNDSEDEPESKPRVVTTVGSLRRVFYVLQNLFSTERFDIEWKNNTLFLSRWVNDPRPDANLGRGAGFEKSTCKYDEHEEGLIKKSASHHRVNHYDFGGLDCIVQSEVDGYLPEPPQASRLSMARVSVPSKASTARKLRRPRGSPFGFEALSLDDPGESAELKSPVRTDNPEVLTTHRCGERIPADRLVEIKTHNGKGTAIPPEPQLYFARRMKLYVAEHELGMFSPQARVKDKEEDLKRWEEENQDVLQKVAALLKVMIGKVAALALEGRIKRTSLICKCGQEGRVEVELYERMDNVYLVPQQ